MAGSASPISLLNVEPMLLRLPPSFSVCASYFRRNAVNVVQRCPTLVGPGGRAASSRHLAGSSVASNSCDGGSELRKVQRT